MFQHHVQYDWRRGLRLLALALLGTLAVTWWTREESKLRRSADTLVCEPRGKAGADCHAPLTVEAHAGATCESFGRGGRICSAAPE